MSSKTVEERVVEMKFNNADFERNVQTTLNTINNLKKNMDFTQSVKGLESISDTTRKISFEGLSSGVEAVKLKFSALEVVAVTALSNIVNTAFNAGERILKALTIDPVTQGYSEYELKMGSIQTIMAGTGESLETVSRYLNELNTYADKTIYSFSDMTSNIGKFTNAGVKLDMAVAAIQGVSNAAAVSGANANEASHAMYNFAQALSAGYVKLIDWKSIENANMATMEFKQQLIDTAVELGTVVRAEDQYQTTTTDAKGSVSDLFDATRNFNDSLSAQWMTTEVLTTTLAKYADETTDIGKKAFAAAQDVKTMTQLFDTLKEAVGSGWAQTWEIIFGDFNEAKEFYTQLSDVLGGVIDKASTARNTFLENVLSSPWKKMSKEITDTGISIDDFESKAVKVASTYGIALDDLIEEHGSLEKALTSLGNTGNFVIVETLKTMANAEAAVGESTEDLSDKLEYFQKVVDEVWHGDYDNSEARIHALAEAGYEYAEVQELVNKTVDGHRLTLEDLGEEQLKSIGYTEEEIKKIRALSSEISNRDSELNKLMQRMSKKSGRELLIDSLMNSINAFCTALGAVKKAWDETIPALSPYGVYTAIESFEAFTRSLILNDEQAGKLTNTFEGVFAIFDAGLSVLKVFLAFGKSALSGVNGLAAGFLEIGSSLGLFINKTEQSAKGLNIFKIGVEKVCDVLTILSNLVGWFAYNGFKAFEDAGGGFKGLAAAAKTSFDDISQAGIDIVKVVTGIDITDKLNDVESKFKSTGNNIKKSVKDWKTSISSFALTSFTNGFDVATAYAPIGQFFSKIKEGLDNTLLDTDTWTGKMYKNITDSYTKLFEEFNSKFDSAFSSLDKKVDGKLSKVRSGVTNNISNIKKSLDDFKSYLKNKLLDGVFDENDANTKSEEYWKRIFDNGKNLAVEFAKSIPGIISDGFKKSCDSVLDLLGKLKDDLSNMFIKNDTSGTEKSFDGLNASMKETQSVFATFSASADKTFKSVATSMGSLTNLELFSVLASIIGGSVYKSFRLASLAIGVFGTGILDSNDKIKGITGTVKEWLSQNNLITASISGMSTGLEKLGNIPVFKAISNSAKSSFTDLRDYFKGGIVEIDAFVERIRTLDGISLKNFKIVVKDFHDSVVKYFLGIDKSSDDTSKHTTKTFTSFARNMSVVSAGLSTSLGSGNGLTFVFENLGTAIGKVIGLLHTTLSSCKDVLGEGGFGGIISILSGVMLIKTVNNIAKTVSNLTNVATGFQGPFKGTEKLLTAFADKVSGKRSKFEVAAEGIKTIAEAIAIVVASLIGLSMMDADKINRSVEILWSIAGALVSLTAATAVIGKSTGLKIGKIETGINSVAMNLLAMGGAILLVIKSIKELSEIDSDKYVSSLIGVAAILTTLVGISVLLNNSFKGDNIRQAITSAVTMVSLSLALKIAVKSFKELAGLSTDEIIKGILGFVPMASALSLVIAACGRIQKGSGTTILTMSALLLVTVSSIKKLGNMDPEVMVKGLMGVAAVFTEYIALLVVIGTIGKLTKGTQTTLIGIAASLTALGIVLKILGNLDAGQIIKGTTVIGMFTSFMGGFILLASMTKSADKSITDVSKAFAMMSASFILMAATMKIVSNMSVGDIAKGIICLTAFTGMFAAVVLVSKYTSGLKDASGTLKLFSVILGELAIIMGALSFIEPDRLITATACFGIIEGMFAALILAVGKLKGFDKSTILTLGSIAAVVSILGYTVYQLASIESPDAALKVATGLSEMMLALSVTLVAVNACDKFAAGGLATLSILSVIAGLLGTVIMGICDNCQNVDQAITVSTAISELILSLSAAMVLLEVAGLGGQAVFVGLGALGTFVTGITLFTSALAGINKLTKGTFSEFLSSGLGILIQVADGIGSFFGTMISSFAESVVQCVPAIGDALSQFAQNSALFFNQMNTVGGSAGTVSKGVLVVTEAILAMTAAELLAGINKLLGIVGFKDLGNQLENFADSISKFVEKTSSLKMSDVLKAQIVSQIAESLSKSLPKMGGVLSWLTGEKNFKKFGEQLEAFGESIVRYAYSVSSISEENVNAMERASKAGIALSELANGLPKDGGFLQKILGSNESMAEFGNQLKEFGSAIVAYSWIVEEFDNSKLDAVKKSAEAGTALNELATSLPKEGGFLQKILGENQSMSEFGAQLEEFGKSIVSYCAVIGDGVDANAVEKSVEAGKMLAELENNLPEYGGKIRAWFTGDKQTLGEFGENILTFGVAIKNYGEQIKDVDPSVVEASANAAQVLVNLENSLKTDKWLDGSQTLKDFGSHLQTFGGNFKAYWELIQGVDASRMSQATSELRDLLSIAKGCEGRDFDGFGDFGYNLTELGKTGIQGFVDAFKNSADSAREAASSFIATFADAIKSNESTVDTAFGIISDGAIQTLVSRENFFEDEGKAYVNRMAHGIENTMNSVTDIFTALCNRSVQNLDSHYSDFYQSGGYLVNGFANGISDNTFMAEAQARAMANAALRAANEALDIHSPSRKTYKTGKYFVLGGVNAVKEFGYMFADAANDMATDGISMFADAFNDIRSVLDKIDMSPTITPVIDMSNIQNGVDYINGMDFTGNIGLATSAISNSAYSKSSINLISDELSKLSDKIDSMGGDTVYNNQKFYISNPDPSDVADAVADKLNLAVKKKEAIWE